MRKIESILFEKYGKGYKSVLREDYIDNSMTIQQMSAKYGISRAPIKRVLSEMGIDIKTQSEQLKEWWQDVEGDERQNMVAAAHAKNKELAEKGELSFQKAWRNKREEMLAVVRITGKNLHKIRKCNGMTGKTGELHHNWNTKRTKEERVKFRKTTEHNAWLKAVYERDNYTCQICQSDKSGTLNAHHLFNYADYEELRHEISNGITLCRDCHVAFHGEYGYGNNTAEQFNEFVGRIAV